VRTLSRVPESGRLRDLSHTNTVCIHIVYVSLYLHETERTLQNRKRHCVRRLRSRMYAPSGKAPALGFEPKSPGPEPGSLSKLAYAGVETVIARNGYKGLSWGLPTPRSSETTGPIATERRRRLAFPPRKTDAFLGSRLRRRSGLLS